MAKKQRKEIWIRRVEPTISFAVIVENADVVEVARLYLKRGKPFVEVGCQDRSLAFWRSNRGRRLALDYAGFLDDDKPEVVRERGKGSPWRDETDEEYKARVKQEEREVAEWEERRERFLNEFEALLDVVETAVPYLQDIAAAAQEMGE